MRSKYLNNLKDSFLHPTGGRAIAMSISGNIAGFSAVPAAAGIAAGVLTLSLGTGGLAIPLVVGIAVALASAGGTFLGVLKSGLGRQKDSILAYPFLAGKLSGDVLGWTAYSLRHPRITFKEASNGQGKQYVSTTAPAPERPATLPAKEMKSAFPKTVENNSAPKSGAADVKIDNPKP